MSEESNNDRDEETKDYENLEEKNGRPISESKAISAQQDRKRRYKQKTNIAGNSNKNRNLKKKKLACSIETAWRCLGGIKTHF